MKFFNIVGPEKDPETGATYTATYRYSIHYGGQHRKGDLVFYCKDRHAALVMLGFLKVKSRNEGSGLIPSSIDSIDGVFERRLEELGVASAAGHERAYDVYATQAEGQRTALSVVPKTEEAFEELRKIAKIFEMALPIRD